MLTSLVAKATQFADSCGHGVSSGLFGPRANGIFARGLTSKRISFLPRCSGKTVSFDLRPGMEGHLMAVKKVSMYQGLVAAAALLALPAIAHAQGMPAQVDPHGLYIGGSVGISVPSDSELNTPGVSREASMESGAAIAAALGYHWGWGIKTEIEGSLRLSRLDGISGVTGAITGDYDVVGIMGNIIYEPSLGWIVRPFIGGGIGYGIAQASNIAPVVGSRVGDSDGGLAWQIMAGIGFNVSPEWTVQVGYRYFNMPDVDFKTDSGVGVSSDYSSHSAMVGLRYHFNVPTPRPPAPAPAA
ncbi:MAG: porin family protein, partial [Alphaproteobacteria bacterium]|nr:porin family protein [Alphaproteobacteria bacterium]